MSNPVLENVINNRENGQYTTSLPMTIQGTINKLFVMTVMLVLSFSAVWYQYSLGYADKVGFLTTCGLIIGFIVAMIICFTRKAMNILVPIYSICEGLALGGLSAIMNAQYPGIVVQAVSLTFLALFAMMGLYSAKVIQATDKFRSVILITTIAIGLFYLVAIIGSFFNIQLPLIYSSSPIGIAFSVIVCGVAALNLILDFDFVERGALNGLSKEYEWYGAFGLMVTIVWLYVEILRLLAKMRNK